ncbi:hypothetical protein, partial [Thermoflexibacter ruber]
FEPPKEIDGFKVRYATLSKGKYQEIFTNDTIQQIGSVYFNRVTGEVVGEVERDSLYFPADVSSRWWSVDPLAEKFPEQSPYLFADGNPILKNDPDGRAASPYYDQNGNYLGVDEHGFKGEVKVTTQQAFNASAKNGVADSKTLSANKDTKGINQSKLDAKAASKVFTHIFSKMSDKRMDVNKLYNKEVSVLVSLQPKQANLNYNDPEKRHAEATTRVKGTDASFKEEAPDGTIKVSVNWMSNQNSYLSTVENIQNMLGVHEFIGHGVLKINFTEGGKEKSNPNYTGKHSNVYLLQINHPTFKNATKEFQQEMRKNYEEFKANGD